jgi:molybdenum cofactor cytidylyltransferase
MAAGGSRRLGQPKQMVMVGGETLLERTIRVANEARLEPVYVMVSAGKTAIKFPPKLTYHLMVNAAAAEGMASSIRTGTAVALANGSVAAVVMACDQPAVTAEHIRKLLAVGDEVVASAYAGRRGVPAYFSGSAFKKLLDLKGDVGARELLIGARCVDLEDGELDVDTPDDLAKAKARFG